MIATTYSGILELFKGYIGGIILLAAGATLFAYDKAPDRRFKVSKYSSTSFTLLPIA